jgi:hypothetical protein
MQYDRDRIRGKYVIGRPLRLDALRRRDTSPTPVGKRENRNPHLREEES